MKEIRRIKDGRSRVQMTTGDHSTKALRDGILLAVHRFQIDHIKVRILRTQCLDILCRQDRHQSAKSSREGNDALAETKQRLEITLSFFGRLLGEKETCVRKDRLESDAIELSYSDQRENGGDMIFLSDVPKHRFFSKPTRSESNAVRSSSVTTSDKYQ